MSSLYTPLPISRGLVDIHGLACNLGIYTEVVAITLAPSKWIQIRVTAGAGGELQIAQGAAGFEVDIVHWGYPNNPDYDIGNLAFEFPAGVRISAKPTTNITLEFHYYY